jgi:ADP-heptose:LPS heptosyltransferase
MEEKTLVESPKEVTFAITPPKPEYIINELGQKVRVFDWEDYQNRIRRRLVYKGNVDLNNKRLIVKHTWGIGDLLYVTCALRGLKQKFPSVKISVICSHPDILEGNPDVDDYWHWQEAGSLMELFDDAREWYWLDYDVPLKGGFDYKRHLRTKPEFNEFILQLANKPPGDLNDDERAFLDQASNSTVNRYKMIALDLYCLHAYINPKVRTVYYYPKAEELDFAERFFRPARKVGLRPIVLMPHTSTIFKDYPHWKKVIEILCDEPYHWVVLDGRITNEWAKIGAMVSDCSGAFRLRHSIAVAIAADLFCCSDTGLLYARASQGGKCVSLYGPHEPDPFLHYFPTVKGLRVKHVTGLLPNVEKCCTIPCYIDVQNCRSGPRRPPPCMEQLDPYLVASVIRDSLA